MRIKRQPLWKTIVKWSLSVLAVIGLLCWIFSGPSEDELRAQLRKLDTEMNTALGGWSYDEDYSRMDREASAKLATGFRAERLRLEDEAEEMMRIYDNIKDVFPGSGKPVLVDTQDDADQYMRQQEEVNAYLSGIQEKWNAACKRCEGQYKTFCKQGKCGPGEGEALLLPDLVALDTLLHRDNSGKPQYLTKADNDALNILDAYKPKCKALRDKIKDAGFEALARQAKHRMDKIDADVDSITELAEKRKNFYESNVKDDILTLNEANRGVEVESEKFNLCLAPHDELIRMKEFKPKTRPLLTGTVIPKTKANREFSLEAADYCIATSADIGTSLLRALLTDWATGKGYKYHAYPNGNGEAAPDRNSRNWFVIKGAGRALGGKAHPEPFEDEYWIYIKPLAANEKAEACIAQGSGGADCVITGENLPEYALKDSNGASRRYDPNSMRRLCSDAVLFVNCTGGSVQALDPTQVHGKASDNAIPRVFFPEGSPERSISDIFSLRPGSAKDRVLAQCNGEQDAMDQAKGGALIIPRHLCNNKAKACAFALPSIKTPDGKIITNKENKLARPKDAACYPDADRIRAHDYLLSYDINVLRQSDKAFGRDFLEYCGGTSAQNCVERCGYIPVRGGEALEFGRLTDADLPVGIVIQKLNEAKAPLGYTAGDTYLRGVRLSNVAFFETNRTDPKEGLVFDFAHQKGLSETMEHLLANGVQGKDFAIVLVGHADVRGSEEYNVDLSEQRACSAVENMLYTIRGKEKLNSQQYVVKKTTSGKAKKLRELLYHNPKDKISLVTLGCGYWRPLSTNAARDTAAGISKKDPEQADALLRNDRRVEFFIIIPKR